MNSFRHDGVAVVLGAAGRLGRHVVPGLAAAGFRVIAVTRGQPPATYPQADWICADLAQADDVQHIMARVFSELTIGGLLVVDLILDRGDVRAMRASLAAATTTVHTLLTRAQVTGHKFRLVTASTTAVLSPWIWQTPYGLAKQRQLCDYSSMRVLGAAVLLPKLTEDDNTDGWLTWTYHVAAAHIASANAKAGVSGMQVFVPAPRQPVDQDSFHARECVLTHLRLLGHLNSMRHHREAAHARLAITPCWLRALVDHHLAPSGRVAAIAKRYRLAIQEISVQIDGQPPIGRRDR